MAEHARAESSDRPRTILPIPDPPPPRVTTVDAKDPDTSFPKIEPLRPPPGAPNVLSRPPLPAPAAAPPRCKRRTDVPRSSRGRDREQQEA